MKTIKFRAYQKQIGVMITLFLSIKPNNHPHIAVEIDPNGELNAGVLENTQDLEVMQFTGLKDRNGKEIYEGDIYKHVEHEYGFHAHDKDTYVVNNLQSFFEEKGLSEGEYGDDYSFIEVIGNIYENPELLTKTK